MAEPGDERELDALFARARGLRAPAGARERVLAQTERALAGGGPRATTRKVAFAAFALAFMSAAASALWLAPPAWLAPARSAVEAGAAHGARDVQRPKRAQPERKPGAQPATLSEPVAPAPGLAEAERPARARPSPGPSELAQQVEAYRQALTLRGRDDARAIELWQEMTRRWPRSPLRHEIDLNVIDALVRLGRNAEARSEARSFLERHPRSSKAAAIRTMLGDSDRSTGRREDGKPEN